MFCFTVQGSTVNFVRNCGPWSSWRPSPSVIRMPRLTKENVFDCILCYYFCHFYSLFATVFLITIRLSSFEPHLIFLNHIFSSDFTRCFHLPASLSWTIPEFTREIEFYFAVPLILAALIEFPGIIRTLSHLQHLIFILSTNVTVTRWTWLLCWQNALLY